MNEKDTAAIFEGFKFPLNGQVTLNGVVEGIDASARIPLTHRLGVTARSVIHTNAGVTRAYLVAPLATSDVALTGEAAMGAIPGAGILAGGGVWFTEEQLALLPKNR